MIISPYQKPFRGLQLNKAHPLARGLVGCWILNEGSGNKVYDSTRNPESYGTFHTTPPTWQPDGLLFDANNESLKWLNGKTALGSRGTIAFRYRKMVTPGSWHYFFVADADWDEFSLLADPGTYELFFIINDSDVANNYIDATTFDGKFHNLVVTWDADANSRKIYRDGLLLFSQTNAFTWSAIGMEDVYLGGRTTNTDRYCGGIISHSHVWNRALTPSEIAQLHREPYAMFETYIDPAMLYVTGVQEYPYTTSGGVVTSGAALIGISKKYVASGSITIAGQAPVSKSKKFIAAGEAVMSGAAITSYVGLGIYEYMAVGGIDTDGLALLAKTRVYYPTGRTAL